MSDALWSDQQLIIEAAISEIKKERGGPIPASGGRWATDARSRCFPCGRTHRMAGSSRMAGRAGAGGEFFRASLEQVRRIIRSTDEC